MEKRVFVGLLVALLVLTAVRLYGQAPAQPMTKVTLKSLHCMSCAKKVAAEVYKVPGVAEMRVDLKAKMVFVVHKEGATPSPKGLWEAIEEADHEPVKMETPTATHTSKPAA
jgi:copper chaperone CopZ